MWMIPLSLLNVQISEEIANESKTFKYIKFIMESENDGQLTFLDLLVKRNAKDVEDKSVL